MWFNSTEETDRDSLQQVGCLANVYSGSDITDDVTKEDCFEEFLACVDDRACVHEYARTCVLSSLGKHTVCVIHGKSEDIISSPRSTSTDTAICSMLTLYC